MAARHTIFTMQTKVPRTYEGMVNFEQDLNLLTNIFLRKKATNDINQIADDIERLKKANDKIEKIGMAHRTLMAGMLNEMLLRSADDEYDNFSTSYTDTIVHEMVQDLRKLSVGDYLDRLMNVKEQATELGMKLSGLLVDLCFLISDEERVLEIIGRFKAELETLTQVDNFMVSGRLFKLLRMGEERVKKYKLVKKSMEENSVLPMEITEAAVDNNFREKLLDINGFIDQCFRDLIEEILNLESCMCQLIRLNLDRVDSCLNLCENSMNKIEEQIRMRRKRFGNSIEFLHVSMKLKVLQIWKQKKKN